MTSADQDEPDRPEPLSSRAYRITVDDGRDSFYALTIEDPAVEDAWIASDTVTSLDSMR